MNRKILFKAKRIYNGEWVEGSLLQTTAVSLKSFIVPSACYTFDKWDWAEWLHVDTDTICQWTGLLDRNGNKIWENDIVNCFEAECFGQISWNESEAGFYFEQFLEGGGFDEENIYDYVDCMEVVGNIFDNPELLEGGAEKAGGTDE